MSINGVIETATGDLKRKGHNVDFTNDGSFDSGSETVRNDVPENAVVKSYAAIPAFSRWNGSAWVTVNQTTAEQLAINIDIRINEIDIKTSGLIGAGFAYDSETFSASLNAQNNWNVLKNQSTEFTWPLDVSTKSNYKYNLAQAELNNFWAAGKDFIKGHLDTGRDLKVSCKDATTQAELDLVIDNR